MTLILAKITSVLLIIFVGYAANKKGILPSEAEPYLNKMLFDIIIPGMIYTTIAAREFTPELADLTLYSAIGAFVYVGLMVVIGFILCNLMYKGDSTIEKGVFVASFSSLNSALIGFPISKALFGDDIMYIIVIVNLAITIYSFVFMPMVMNMGRPRDPDEQRLTLFGFVKLFGKSLWSIAPMSVFVSMAMLFMGLRFPTFIEDFLSTCGNGTTVVAMLIVGMQLGRNNIRVVMKKTKEVIFFTLKLIIMPVVIFLIIDPIPVITEIKVGLIFAGALPAGVMPAIIAANNDHNPTPCAEAVVITSIISIAVMGLTALLLTSYYGL